MSWVNKDILIDFYLPEFIWDAFKELEELDEKRDSFGYAIRAEELDIMCKNGYAGGSITKEQWHRIERRYCERIWSR